MRILGTELRIPAPIITVGNQEWNRYLWFSDTPEKLLRCFSVYWKSLCCLIFQTLRSRDLEEYMLLGTARTGCHLDIANPLWQSFLEITSDNFERKEFFRDLLQDNRSISERLLSILGKEVSCSLTLTRSGAL